MIFQAWDARDNGTMDELFDPALYYNDESQLMEIKRCVEVALLCTQCDRADRPPHGGCSSDATWPERVADPKETKLYV